MRKVSPTSSLMNKTLLLAPVGDKARAEATQMKRVHEVPVHLDLRGDSEGEARDCSEWILVRTLISGREPCLASVCFTAVPRPRFCVFYI